MENRIKLAREHFDSYYASFKGLTEEQTTNFNIKYRHSLRVAEMSKRVATRLDLKPHDVHLAVIIGLFHDIGRFKQLVEFNTFNDAVSVDHAKYSVGVLNENGFLAGLEEADTVITAIRHHNKLMLPDDLSGKDLFFAKLIRDADKLDILKVITDYYTAEDDKANHTLTWEMPSGDTVSPKVVEQVLAQEQIARVHLKNQLDIKVMQLSWVFDLNYKSSLEILKEKGYIKIIYNTMPQNEITSKIYEKVRHYMEKSFVEAEHTTNTAAGL